DDDVRSGDPGDLLVQAPKRVHVPSEVVGLATNPERAAERSCGALTEDVHLARQRQHIHAGLLRQLTDHGLPQSTSIPRLAAAAGLALEHSSAPKPAKLTDPNDVCAGQESVDHGGSRSAPAGDVEDARISWHASLPGRAWRQIRMPACSGATQTAG